MKAVIFSIQQKDKQQPKVSCGAFCTHPHTQQQKKPILSKQKTCQAEEGAQPQEQTGWGRDLPYGQLSLRGGCAIVRGENIREKQIAWLRHHVGIQISRIWISYKQI